MKLFRIIFAVYLLTLLWIVLLKTSIDLPLVFGMHVQKINLIPFAGFAQDFRGMIDNTIIFVPLGLLLGVNFKHVSLYQKIAFIALLSCTVEILQFIFAIGVTDITDVITNVSGGIIGLLAYNFGAKHTNNKELDQVIATLCTCLLLVTFFLRFFVFQVRY